MKNYVFLTGGIEGINGVVIYLDNKIKYLINKGYRVVIISPNIGEVYVKSLQKYFFYRPYMKYYPSSYRKSIINRYLCDLKKICDGDRLQETIIESHNYNLSCWGEILAKTLGGKHIHLLVTENPKIYTEEFYQFMKFKLDRYELFGMNEKTIPMLMNGRMNLEISERYLMQTPCDNTVQDVDSGFLDEIDRNVDYRICTVSRFDKSYVMPMIDKIEEFCEKTNSKIQIFFIGGAYHQENIERIHERLNNNEYINYVITGFQYPVALKLLHSMDVAIGCAGSVLTTYRAGVPTIPLDVSDFEPVGIFGVTTNSTHYKEEGKEEADLTKLLTEILIEKHVVTQNLIPNYGDLTAVFDEHLKKISKSNLSNKYFDVLRVVNEEGSYKRRMCVMHIIGPRAYCILNVIKNKILRKEE